ncbi:NADP-dependent oxidoreductase [Psychromonas aquimarina]|uniref:NADP-dependent oxidoreductase n=1 Tax=Psychromonas aquimarina TaxID=444919 RepID=UPI000414A0BD|nr:NADP-dependent oxidoreductase [Psychromonas aquimarina]
MRKTNLMKASVIPGYGDADSFELIQLPVPDVKAGEVLIRVAYAGINPADWKYREGLLAQHVNIQFPGVLGNDVSGVVVEVGEGVTRFTPGDKVFAFTNISKGGLGAYAEYTAVDEDRIALVPEEVSLKSAAVIPTAALTSWQNLLRKDRGNLQAGQKVLINGGSGGLGSYAVQFAKWAGAEVAATCGSSNQDYVQSLGADLVIDYRKQNISGELAKWALEGVDIILDTVGTKSLPDALSMIKKGGRLVSIPTMDADMDDDVAGDIAEAASLGISKIFDFCTLETCGKDFSLIISLLAEGKITDPMIETFSIDEVCDAHKKQEEGHVQGKLVLEIAGETIT